MRTLPQRCPLATVYLTWFGSVAGLVALWVVGRYALLGGWLVALPAFVYGYVRLFPKISSGLGYGSVEDRPLSTTPADAASTAPAVTLYTGAGCPFCPIVEARLKGLQQSLGFQLTVVDVTLRPDLAARHRIGSVPVVEVAGRRRAGCATSDELALLIGGGQAEPAFAGAGGRAS